MWMHLAFACLAAVLVLYVPGCLIFRAMRFTWPVSLCAGPVASVALYASLPVLYDALGITCGWAMVLLPTLLVGVGACAVAKKRGGLGSSEVSPGVSLSPMSDIRIRARRLDFNKTVMLAYVLVATVVCLCVFVANLPHADAFYSRFDNQTHLNVVQAFLDSGRWSTLHTSAYLAADPAQAPTTLTDGGFYPAAWHVLVALVCDATGVSVALGTNAVVIAVCATVLPLGMYLFIRALFPSDRLAAMLGAIVTSACAAFPWVFVVKGPTWPDLLGVALLSAVLAVVVLFVEQSLVRRNKLLFATFAVCSFVSVALAHPNGVFTAYVFLAAYGLHVILRRHRTAMALGYCCAIVAVWIACYKAPPLQSILQYHHSESEPVPYVLAALCSLSFLLAREQPVLMVGLLAGVILCVRRRRWWLLFAPLFFGACYVVCYTDCEFLKYWLAALWYMTSYRFISRVMLFCIPLISWGFSEICKRGQSLCARSAVARAVLVAALVACCFVNYWPRSLYDRTMIHHGSEEAELINDAAYGRMSRRIYNAYDKNIEHVYSTEEVRFVDDAMALIPQDALVINTPRDGSMWAYAINHLNAYYRKQTPSNETEDSALIRTRLNHIATDEDVRRAVQQTGAAYVLLLDKDVSFEEGVWLPQFHKKYQKAWRGIEKIDDTTPGFEVVLARGDQMRLYRIDV